MKQVFNVNEMGLYWEKWLPALTHQLKPGDSAKDVRIL
jgi:hypothetical protein